MVGALDAVTPNLSKHLDAIGVTTRIELLQKAALLGTARLLRRVQWNLDYPDLDYPDFSITRTFSVVRIWS